MKWKKFGHPSTMPMMAALTSKKQYPRLPLNEGAGLSSLVFSSCGYSMPTGWPYKAGSGAGPLPA
jgi:hypothetical protein